MGGLALIDGNAEDAARLGAYPLARAEIGRAAPSILLVAAGRFDGVAGSTIPVLVVDAPDDPSARAALLDAGAADLVPPGTDPIELAARARAILRRDMVVCHGDLVLDLRTRCAARGGRPLALHPREFTLLAHFVRNGDRCLTRAELYAAVWRRTFDPGSNVVAVAVSRLRAKLDAGGRTPVICTVPGGYMLATVAGG